MFQNNGLKMIAPALIYNQGWSTLAICDNFGITIFVRSSLRKNSTGDHHGSSAYTAPVCCHSLRTFIVTKPLDGCLDPWSARSTCLRRFKMLMLTSSSCSLPSIISFVYDSVLWAAWGAGELPAKQRSTASGKATKLNNCLISHSMKPLV